MPRCLCLCTTPWSPSLSGQWWAPVFPLWSLLGTWPQNHPKVSLSRGVLGVISWPDFPQAAGVWARISFPARTWIFDLNSWSLVMFSKPGNCMTKDWSHASCVVFMGCFVYGPPPSLQYCSDLDVAFLSFGSLWVSFLDLWPVVFSPRWLDGKQCLGRCLLHKGCQWICVE